MFTSCAYILRTALTGIAELAGIVRVEKDGTQIIDHRCSLDPTKGKFCADHQGSVNTEDIPSRVILELQFTENAKGVWESFGECATTGTVIHDAKACADIKQVRSKHPTFQPKPPVVKAKKVDLSTFVPLMRRKFGYIHEVATGVRKKEGKAPIYWVQIKFARDGHFHSGPAGLSAATEEKITEQLSRASDVRVYRNPGFWRAEDGKRSCLHVVEVFNSHADTIEPIVKLSFNDGLWSAQRLNPLPKADPGLVTTKLGDHPGAVALANMKAKRGEFVPGGPKLRALVEQHFGLPEGGAKDLGPEGGEALRKHLITRVNDGAGTVAAALGEFASYEVLREKILGVPEVLVPESAAPVSQEEVVAAS